MAKRFAFKSIHEGSLSPECRWPSKSHLSLVIAEAPELSCALRTHTHDKPESNPYAENGPFSRREMPGERRQNLHEEKQ